MASVYPNLPIDAETYRITILKEILSRLKRDLQEYEQKSSEMRKRLEKCRTSSKLLGSIGTAVGVAGGTVGATGFGIPLGASLIAIGALMGAGSVISMQVEKRFFEKLDKYNTSHALAYSKLQTIEQKVSKALSDNKISEQEFEEIYQEEGKYMKQKTEILSPAKITRNSKNSASTRELADQLALLLKNAKRSSRSM